MALDEIEETLVDIDDDGARPLPALIAHRLGEVLRRHGPGVPAGVTSLARHAGRMRVVTGGESGTDCLIE